MSFCPNCGSELPANTKFCPSCGQVIGAADQVENIQNTAASYGQYEQVPSEPVRTEPLPEYQQQTYGGGQYAQQGYQDPSVVPAYNPNQTAPGSYQPSYEAYKAQPGGSAVNGFGIAALVLGIAAFFLNFLIFIPSVLAVIFGCLGIAKGNSQGTGKGMAIAGLVCGIIAALIYIIALIASASLVRYAFWR